VECPVFIVNSIQGKRGGRRIGIRVHLIIRFSRMIVTSELNLILSFISVFTMIISGINVS